MKNTILNRSTVNLAVVAISTLLFAGSALAAKPENQSEATTAAHMRTGASAAHMRKVDPAKGNTDNLQPNANNSPEFTQWGPQTDL